MWRRQSLPKFSTKNGKKSKSNGSLPRSRSLRNRSKTALNGLSKLLPSPKDASLKADYSTNDATVKVSNTDLNESYTSLENMSHRNIEDRNCPEIREAESVA